jgi:hypothetical protein
MILIRHTYAHAFSTSLPASIVDVGDYYAVDAATLKEYDFL